MFRQNFAPLFAVTALLVVSGLLATGSFPPSAFSAGPNGLSVLESTDSRVVVVLDATEYQVEPVPQTDFQRITAPGLGEMGDPGAPRLPLAVAMVAIPPGASYAVSSTGDAQNLPGVWNIAPVPTATFTAQGKDTLVQPTGAKLEPAPAIYRRAENYPREFVRVTGDQYLRSQRVLRIELAPFQFNPVAHSLTYRQQIRVTIDLSYPSGRGAQQLGQAHSEGGFESTLQSALLNYDSARTWRGHPPAPAKPLVPSAPTLPGPLYKISINQDGLYFASCATLQSAGVSLATPDKIQLFKNNVELPINVIGMNGGCNSGDGVEFYGLATTTPYTTTNVYWLTTGVQTGLRMAPHPGAPNGGTVPSSFVATKHLEQDVLYIPRVPVAENANHWFWDFLNGAGASVSYNFNLTNVSSDSGTVSLQYFLQGYTTAGHIAQIVLNGTALPNIAWSGAVPQTGSLSVSASLLVNGQNSIVVKDIGDPNTLFDQFYTKSFDIQYLHSYTADGDQLVFGGDSAGDWQYHVGGYTGNAIELFDITDPANVAQITGAVSAGSGPYELQFEDNIGNAHRYVALTSAQRLAPLSVVPYTSANLKSASNAADYIVITRGDLISGAAGALQDLKNLRTSQGLRVKFVDVQNIYDEFNDGVFSPIAIRDFLQYAFYNWSQNPAPQYVVLIGDGTYDYKNFTGLNADNVVPPYLAFVDPLNGEVDADNRFVAFTGAPYLPQMYLGRLPAKSAADVTAMVNKLKNYETGAAGAWRSNVIFVADNTPDTAGDFQAQSEDIANNYLPSTYAANKLYMNTICGPNPSQGNTTPCPAMNSAIVNAINGSGGLIVQWTGHGGFQYWAHENVFNTANSLPQLTNGAQLPIFLPWTCYNGWFTWPYPSLESLAEQLVRQNNAGAIAVFGPTGADIDTGHHYLNIGFFQSTFQSPSPMLGPATQAAKLYLNNNSSGNYLELIDTYLLFGDPAMRIAVPPAVVQNDAPAIQYNSWRGVSDANASGGTYRVSKALNAQVTYKFTGTAITWVTEKGPDQGKARVTIDGVSKGTFDLYNPTAQWNVQQTFSKLSNKAHTLVVRVLGTKNVKSKGANVTVDAFIVGATTTEESASGVKYNSWTGVSDSNASGGTYRSSAPANATASLTFTGTGINWVTALGPSYGKAQVLIDGKVKATVDLYAKTQQWQVAKFYGNLSAGQHTIQIKVLGTKRTASKGTTVVVDAFSGQISTTGTSIPVSQDPEEDSTPSSSGESGWLFAPSSPGIIGFIGSFLPLDERRA